MFGTDVGKRHRCYAKSIGAWSRFNKSWHRNSKFALDLFTDDPSRTSRLPHKPRPSSDGTIPANINGAREAGGSIQVGQHTTDSTGYTPPQPLLPDLLLKRISLNSTADPEHVPLQINPEGTLSHIW